MIVLQEVISKTVFLCEDGGRYLSTGVGSALSAVVELLNAEEPPLIWAGAKMLECPKLHDSLRYAALEMDEHLETYFDRKDHANEVTLAIIHHFYW